MKIRALCSKVIFKNIFSKLLLGTLFWTKINVQNEKPNLRFKLEKLRNHGGKGSIMLALLVSIVSIACRMYEYISPYSVTIFFAIFLNGINGEKGGILLTSQEKRQKIWFFLS